mgnify:CR=1 FL=1
MHHDGESPDSGHYYATVTRNDHSFKVNNFPSCTIESVSTDDCVSNNVYYAIYQRKRSEAAGARRRLVRVAADRQHLLWNTALAVRQAAGHVAASNGGRKLHNVHVNGFLRLVMRAFADTHFLDSSCFDSISQTQPIVLQRTDQLGNSAALRVIAAPYFASPNNDEECDPNASHCFLCVVYVRSKVIVIYDSVYSKHQRSRERAGLCLLQWVERQFRASGTQADTSPNEWKVVTQPQPPPPPDFDFVACRTFVCAYALAVARGRGLSLATTEVLQCRRYVTTCLQQERFLLPRTSNEDVAPLDATCHDDVRNENPGACSKRRGAPQCVSELDKRAHVFSREVQ